MSPKSQKLLLALFTILLEGYFAAHGWTNLLGRYGKLLFVFEESVSNSNQIVDLLKLNKDKLSKTLENVCVQPLIVYLPDPKGGKLISEVPFSEIELLVSNAKVHPIELGQKFFILVSARSKLFEVAIPYIVKNRPYKIIGNQVMIKDDEKSYYRRDQTAPEIKIYVDGDGKVYW